MKQILVTGDSKGVGLQTSKLLLTSGYSVVGISRTTTQGVLELIDQFKDRYIHITYDLSDSQGVDILYKNQIKPLGKFDGFVNNAAVAYDDIITNIDLNKL